MTTTEIDYCLSRVSKKQYLGCLACDQLPKNYIQAPWGAVVNTHPSHKPGERWVAIFVDKNNFLNYFDSFGLPPMEPLIVSFVNKFENRRINDFTFQNIDSINCGHYCIFFLYACFKRMTFSNIISLLKKQGKLVDKFVINFAQKLFSI